MSDIRAARNTLTQRILQGEGETSPSQRRAAFDNSGLSGPAGLLVNTVARHAYRVTDDDIAAVKTSGVSEDQIFELVICAALGQATRQYEAGTAALKKATGKE